ncbi:MAG: DUF1844 domain-containing protein [bacterium]|nr:DUF1844 domain-containing protein [bacterium]
MSDVSSQKGEFADLVFMLSTSGLVHLGDIPDPVTNESKRNLEGTRWSIDMLALLEKKTRGNLTDEESKLLTGVLYNLRMRYLEALKEEEGKKIEV